jgi:hypothetical protein
MRRLGFVDFPGGAKREILLDIGGGCGEDSR